MALGRYVDHSPLLVFVSSALDSVGQEVVNATIDVLKSVQQTLKTFELEFTELDWGTARYKSTGKYMPEDGLDVLRKFDAGLFGAVGAPGMNYKSTPKSSIYPDNYHVLFTRCPRPHLPVESALGYTRAHAAVCKR